MLELKHISYAVREGDSELGTPKSQWVRPELKTRACSRLMFLVQAVISNQTKDVYKRQV